MRPFADRPRPRASGPWGKPPAGRVRQLAGGTVRVVLGVVPCAVSLAATAVLDDVNTLARWIEGSSGKGPR